MTPQQEPPTPEEMQAAREAIHDSWNEMRSAAPGPDPGSFGGHPYTPDEIALGYGTDHDSRFVKPDAATSPYSALFDHEHDARTEGLLALVGFELRKAQSKFKPFNSAHEGKAVIEEELDELWEHVKANTGDGIEAFEEAIQIAAMALRYAYDISTVSAYEVAT